MAMVGSIARAHGLKGEVIVNVETDYPGVRFQPGAELFVNHAGRVEPMTIATVRFQRDRPVLGFREVTSVDAAAALAGSELRIPADRLTALPP
jgi:16S rRNA processing protein RimM